MQQKTKLGINFGFRGWMLMIFEITAFLVFQAFGNFPMNMLADFYGGAARISPIYTVASLVGIAIQLFLANKVPKMKSVRTLTLGFGVATLITALGVATLPAGPAWFASYFLVNVMSNVYGMFGIGILIGQWFPTRKGVFMGIATFAFPVCNGLMGPFSKIVFRNMATTHVPDVFGGFLPFLIVGLVGWLIGLIFIKDYPEQVGSYRDNDKNMTPEIANAIMAQEIENKKTTVWKLGPTLKCGQFWLITIPMGTLLACAVGAMTQTSQIIGAYDNLDFSATMGIIMIAALIGSYILGLIDGRFGTKKAITVSVVVMLIAAILGGIGSKATILPALIAVAVFMGASSNFTVSAAAQYWRREDFPSVFGAVNPIANIIQCAGPLLFAISIAASQTVTLPFWITAVIAVISLILILCFKPAKVKEIDDRYREKAGKLLDDALDGRL